VQPALRSGALETMKQREVVMNGPLKLVQGNFGTISRIPIFIEDVDQNETFGNNTSGLQGRGPCSKVQFHRCVSSSVS
jgi:sensor domain CHASE-containing protein